MKFFVVFTLVMGQSLSLLSQSKDVKATDFAEATFAIGDHEGSLSILYMHDWRFGSSKKWGVGLGARITSYLGANQYYITAPAKLTSESSSPLIFFKENIKANIDSLLIQSPQTNSINASINIDYRIFSKLTVGFNIDAIGFSFGMKKKGNYINGVQGKNAAGNPTAFNVLLVSDNDRGSLNSEFYFKYLLADKWAIKTAAQFLFTEYTTEAEVQQFPSANDRFRNKSLMFAFGVSHQLN